MIETEISYDAVDPGIERALEAKAWQVYVRPKKRFLINVLTILLRTGQMDGEAQHGAVVLLDQFFEGGGIALLGLADKQGVIHGDGTSLANLWPGAGKSSNIDISWCDASFASVTHDHHLRPHVSSIVQNLRSFRILDHSESSITHLPGVPRSEPCRPRAIGCQRSPRPHPARKKACRLHWNHGKPVPQQPGALYRTQHHSRFGTPQYRRNSPAMCRPAVMWSARWRNGRQPALPVPAHPLAGSPHARRCGKPAQAGVPHCST